MSCWYDILVILPGPPRIVIHIDSCLVQIDQRLPHAVLDPRTTIAKPQYVPIRAKECGVFCRSIRVFPHIFRDKARL